MRTSTRRLGLAGALALSMVLLLLCPSGDVRANASPVPGLSQLPTLPAYWGGLTADFDPLFGFRVFDDFETEDDVVVDGLTFQGTSIDFATEENNPVGLDAFAYFVEIYGNGADNRPSDELYASYLFYPNEVQRTFVQLTDENYPVYDFEVTFPAELLLEGGERYWLSVYTSSPNGNPIFVWLSGLGGNGIAYQDVFEYDPVDEVWSEQRFEREIDLAFTFKTKPEYLQPPTPLEEPLGGWTTDVDTVSGFRTYDDFFVEDEPMTIGAVVFQGFYLDYVSSVNNPVAPDTYGWDVGFYSSTYNSPTSRYEPDDVLRQEFHFADTVQRRFLGYRAFGAVTVPMYEITIVLNEPFVAEPQTNGLSKRYWFSPRSRSASFNPLFSWATGVGATESCIQDVDNLTDGPGDRFKRAGDRAFDLCELVPPTAVVDENTVVNSTDSFVLDGSGSFDDNTAPINLLYLWTLEDRPEGSSADVDDAEAAVTSFIPDVSGDYRFELVVIDKDLLPSEPASITVTYNQLPVARAGDDRIVLLRDLVLLDGSASEDPDGPNVTLQWSWTILARPDASAADLVDPTSMNPVLQPDVAGVYLVQLIVSDALNDSLPDVVEITAADPTDYVAAQLAMASEVVDLLPDSDFATRGARRQLQRTFSISAMLAQRQPVAARAVLRRTLALTDGCALRGAPDTGGRGQRRDTILDCDAQLEVYAAILEALRGLSNRLPPLPPVGGGEKARGPVVTVGG